MKRIDFDNLCEEYGVYPSIALENENLVDALKNKLGLEVIRNILEEEF
jgi:hypothetical protein